MQESASARARVNTPAWIPARVVDSRPPLILVAASAVSNWVLAQSLLVQ